MAGKSYDFFISYAHADVQPVRELDSALRALLRRPFRRAGFKVFRDETGLGADPDLSGRIRAALERSSWLLLVLTKESAGSPWVDREIEYWCEELRRLDRLIVVRADPSIDLTWDDGADRFGSPAGLPPAFARAAKAEPLYVDLQRDSIEEAAVRVAAAILGRAPEDVAGEDLRLHRRRRRLATGAIAGLAALTLTSVAASVVAMSSSATASRNEARAIEGEREAQVQARKAVADALAARAIVEQDERPDKAFALALASSRLDPSGSGESVLLRLVAGVQATDQFFRIETEPTAVALSADGEQFAIGDATGKIRLGSFESGLRPPSADLGSAVVGIGFAAPDRLVAGLADNRIVELELVADGTLRETSSVSVPMGTWAFDPRDGRIAVLGGESLQPVLTLVESDAGGLVERARRTDLSGVVVPSDLSFSRDGSTLGIVDLTFDVLLLDASSLETIEPRLSTSVELDTIALADSELIAAGTPPGSTTSSGFLAVHGDDGEEVGSVGFEQAVTSLAACGDRVLFGTAAGEYGWVGDPVPASIPAANIAERVRSVACTESGGFVVVGEGGFVHLRSAEVGRTANEFQLVARGEDTILTDDDRFGMHLADDFGAVRTGTGMVLPFDEEQEVTALLAGESPLASNCVSMAPHDPLKSGFDVDGDDVNASESLATCGMKRIQANPAPGTLELEVHEGSRLSRIGALNAIPYALAWSADGRRAFVGSGLEGVVYSLPDRAPPQEILRLGAGWSGIWAASGIGTSAVFTSASFAAEGNVLVATVHYPPAYNWDIALHVVGGRPLQRLSCRLSQGSLDDTVAVELLRDYDTNALGCEAVHR